MREFPRQASPSLESSLIRTGFRRACTGVVLALWLLPVMVSASTDVVVKCPAVLAGGIPARPARAPAGSDFADSLAAEDGQLREAAIRQEILRGNLPRFLRRLKPVKLTQMLEDGREVAATICVMPDYLAVGSDRDFLRMPMNLHTAAGVADDLGFMLPTRKMVDAIYEQSDVHLRPQPMRPGPEMSSIDYYVRHNHSVTAQIASLNAPLGALISGNKKDVVLSNRLATRPGRIAIYGWHRPDGEPIQPLSTVHGANYADYSHGVRLVSDTVYIDGKAAPMRKVLRDPVLAAVLSDEGPVRAVRVLGL